MEILRLDATLAEPIGERPFAVRAAASLELAHGGGEAHAHLLVLEPGGELGPHEAGFGQLLVPLEGSGWVAGPDGRRLPLRPGEAALIARGEVHAKGSREGMTALMLQVRDLAPRGRPGVSDTEEGTR